MIESSLPYDTLKEVEFLDKKQSIYKQREDEFNEKSNVITRC